MKSWHMCRFRSATLSGDGNGLGVSLSQPRVRALRIKTQWCSCAAPVHLATAGTACGLLLQGDGPDQEDAV